MPNDRLDLDYPLDVNLRDSRSWRRDVVPDEIEFNVTAASTEFEQTPSAGSQHALGLGRGWLTCDAVAGHHLTGYEISPSAWNPTVTLPHITGVLFGADVVWHAVPRVVAAEDARHMLNVSVQVLRADLPTQFGTAVGSPCLWLGAQSTLPEQLPVANTGWEYVGHFMPPRLSLSSRDELSQIDSLLSAVAAIPRIGSAISLRVRFLEEQSREDESDEGVSVGSLFTFFTFLRCATGVQVPSISLTPDGYIYASWNKNGRTFSVHFLPTGEARYVLFRPAPNNAPGMLRSSGSVPVAASILQIPETGAANWVYL